MSSSPGGAIPPIETWDEWILRSMPSGIDVTLLVERLALTPTERLERMIAVVRALDEAKAERDGRRVSSTR